ncbi:MAG: ABC transporter ATP-binding protein [Anaerolineae bacterium]|nr:ABC transporter ATP-binding protein [Anaerolineae bacterium]
MIEIDGLTKTYSGDVQALRGLTLDIGSGMFGLLGPNGAGKTTLMRVIAGLLKPSSGSVRVLGEDITTQGGKLAVKRQLGYLPQELGLYPNLTGREFLDYISVLKGISDKRERARQVHEILDLVRLTDQADRRLKTYSGGMKRRIGIGQALLGYPKLLIVDEPTAGLDPEERVRFRNLLADMAARCTVILSTHVIEDISHSCNDLAIIRNGRVLFRGQPGELIGLALGRVWSILTSGDRPMGDLKVVSTLQLQNGVQYRVIGMPSEHYQAQAVEPSLEDGYMLAMGQ